MDVVNPKKVQRYLEAGGDPARVYRMEEGSYRIDRTMNVLPNALCYNLQQCCSPNMHFNDPKQPTIIIDLGSNVTPIHVAAYLKAEESIKLLLAAGGPDLLKLKTGYGATALDLAVEVNAKPSIISLLQGDSGTQSQPVMSRGPHAARNVIMISYQWDSQVLAFKVRDCLEKHGKTVIIDTGGIGGNFLDWMNESVEKCEAMIVVLTPKYEASKNCEREACRAHELKKQIVPLVAEKGYHGGGWLSMIIAGLLRYDVYTDELFDANMERILEREF